MSNSKATRMSREELYELVWTAPLRTLAPRFGISDVALAKACRNADIPLPGLGTWAKSLAGKKVVKPKLPRRGIGKSDSVVLGGNRWWYAESEDSILGEIPPSPLFEADLDVLRHEVRKTIGAVKVPRVISRYHFALQKLVDEDEVRREKANSARWVSSWDQPRFDSAIARRKLRIVNSIFMAVARAGGKGGLQDKDAIFFSVQTGDHRVHFKLDVCKPSRQRAKTAPVNGDQLELALGASPYSDTAERVWRDTTDTNLGDQLAEICVELVVGAEAAFRQARIGAYEWRLKRRADLLEEREKARLKAIRDEKERMERLEAERVNRLLTEASDFQRAMVIRDYIGKALQNAPSDVEESQLQRWAEWARGVADRLDPLTSGRFVDVSAEEWSLLGSSRKEP